MYRQSERQISRETRGVERMRTYYLGQTAMVPLDLVWDVLSSDERRPEEYEGIRRTGDVRRILASVFGIGTGRT